MKLHTNLIVAALCTFAFACGGDEDSSESAGEPIEDQATIDRGKDTAQTSQTFTTLEEGMDDAAGKGPITSVGGAIQAWVGQHQASKAQAQAMSLGLESAMQAQVAEGGTYSFENGHLSADLTYNTPQAAIHYAAELDIGENTLDGTFDLDFSASQAQYEIAYDYAVTYEGVVFTAECATAGTIKVDYAFEVGGALLDNLPAEQRAMIADQVGGEGHIEATFGEGCTVEVTGR